MHRVTVIEKTPANLYHCSQKTHEIRNWCRDTFGKNPRKGEKIWMISDYVSYGSDLDDEVYIWTGYFKTESMKSAFLLRWTM